ncbi:serine/threonine protein phosphatase [Lysinibacillus antri]|uniref:Serine/threonine protein phosphatase n=1 Tax=Lysinibacillus antri TaxID=2498145 RepID=A0A3S0R578_9BACI|nr:serine/threonine protein phosphatase [Lysinibacillus antri]
MREIGLLNGVCGVEKVFAIGDIHGNYELLEQLLQFWNPDEEQLVFLGDYIDRGPDSLKVLQTIMDLSEQYEIITLAGNHEQIFLSWLDKPEEVSEFYFNPKIGGADTVKSLYDVPHFSIVVDNFSVIEIAEAIRKKQSAVIKFLKQLRTFYQWDSYLFVHAGIDATVENFKETNKEDYFWIREDFFATPHLAKEIVVFGHTPTPLLNEDRSSNVWVSPCRKKIGIDGGGAIYEAGQLHGLLFSSQSKEIKIYSVAKNTDGKYSTILL